MYDTKFELLYYRKKEAFYVLKNRFFIHISLTIVTRAVSDVISLIVYQLQVKEC